ncbi:MAG: ATP-binding protein, partial [bacterium]
VWLVTALLLVAAAAGFFLHFFRLETIESGETIFVIEIAGKYLLGLTIIAAAFAFLQLENTFRASTGSVRRALMAPVGAFAAFLVVTIITGSLGLLYGVVRFAGVELSAALLVLMLILVSRFLVFEEEMRQRVVLSRQAVYSSVGVLLIGAYLIVVGIAIKLLTSLGGNPKVFFSVVAGFVVVLAFLALLLSGSVKARLRGLVDRTVMGGKIDLPMELASYADDVTTVADKQQMFAITARVLREKCGLDQIGVYQRGERLAEFVPAFPDSTAAVYALPNIESWLRRSTKLGATTEIVGAVDEASEAEIHFLSEWSGGYLVPLLARQELVGFLACRSTNRLGSEVILLVETISHQLALSLLSARQYEALLEAKELASFHKVSSFVIHDVKNLISMVSMILQNAEHKFDDPRFQETTINTLASAQRRMKRMIGRLSAPREEADFPIGDCDLDQIVLDLIEEMKLRGNPRLLLEVEVSGLPPVRGNLEKVKSVVGNLLINAIEAMPSGGQLRIFADETNDGVRLSVADSGVGMTAEFMSEKLFRPFRTSKPGGLGIGLFQSRELARQMAGDLFAVSTIGEGSTFTLKLRKS